MPDARRAVARALLPAAALLAALLAGALLRGIGGWGLLSSELVYAAPAESGAPGSASPADGSPADAVRSFYLLLDRGEYAAAWGLSREPDYTGSGDAPYRSAVPAGTARGWTSREAFVRRLDQELGSAGEWLRLGEVQAAEAAPAAGHPGYPRSAAWVRAQGTLMGACTIFRWEKDLPVAREGGRYRVLLPGTKQEKALYYQEWFANLRRIGTLRGTAP